MSEALAMPKVTIQAKPQTIQEEVPRTWAARGGKLFDIEGEAFDTSKVLWAAFRSLSFSVAALCVFNEMAYMFSVSFIHTSTLLKETFLGPFEVMYDIAYGIIKHW
jgi:hypothetical protein